MAAYSFALEDEHRVGAGPVVTSPTCLPVRRLCTDSPFVQVVDVQAVGRGVGGDAAVTFPDRLAGVPLDLRPDLVTAAGEPELGEVGVVRGGGDGGTVGTLVGDDRAGAELLPPDGYLTSPSRL